MKTKTITVKVTQADIKAGADYRDSDRHTWTQPLSRNCAIACSLKRLGFEAVDVMPFAARIDLSKNGPNHAAEMPDKAVEWAHEFDRCKPVKPFSFRLKVPAQ